MLCVRRCCDSWPVEEHGALPAARQDVGRGPLSERQHPPPLAEDHDFQSLGRDELFEELAKLLRASVRRGCRGLSRWVAPAFAGGATSSKSTSARPLQIMRWVVSSCMRRRNSLCSRGRFFARPEEIRDGPAELLMCLVLLRRQVDRDARVAALGKLRQHLVAAPAQKAVREPFAERGQVACPARLPLAIRRDDVPRSQPPLRLERGVVHPAQHRRELIEPVLHGRPGEHEPVARVEPLHRLRRLRLPVLDPLGFVQDHDVRRPAMHEQEIAQDLLVVHDEESRLLRSVLRRPILGGTAHDGDRRVGELLPFAQPLRLERGRDDNQAPLHGLRSPEGMAGGDGLRRLAEPHVVAEEQPPIREGPPHSLLLIRIELPLESLRQLLEIARDWLIRNPALQPDFLGHEEQSQRRVHQQSISLLRRNPPRCAAGRGRGRVASAGQPRRS